MTTAQIDCFLAAAHTGSFAAAAKDAYLSVQTVSQNIQNLEKELSVQLFDRRRDGVALTDAGQRFLSFAAQWIGLYNSTMQSIEELYSNLSMSLSVGLSEYVDTVGAITGGLSAFAEEHETVNISCTQFANRDIYSALQQREIDIAIMCDTQIINDNDCEVVRFAKEDLRLYLSHMPPLPPDIKLRDQRLPDLCRGIPQLDASYGPWTREEWAEISRRMSIRLGLPEGEHIEMPSFRTVIACLQAIPSMAVCDARFGYLRDGDALQSIPLGLDSYLCCVWDKRNENPLIPEFSSFLLQYYET